jgi:site-specific recombinase XerC
MAVACPGDLAGVRDRALLLLAAAGLDRAALVGLDFEALDFTPTAVTLWFGSTAIEAVPRHEGAIARDAKLAHCPVRALQDWLELSDTRFGPVFRKIDRWGNVEHSRLGTDAIRRVLARRRPRRLSRGRKRPA